MENLEIKRGIMDTLAALAHPNIKLSSFIFNASYAERIKDFAELSDRKKKYEALVWISEHPEFDPRTAWHEKISFTKKEVFDLLIRFKAFYEDEQYGLLTDDRPRKKMPHEEGYEE